MPMRLLLATALCCLPWLTACQPGGGESEWRTSGTPVDKVEDSGIVTITLGDIDPDTPTSRMLRIRPLADHLSAELGWERSRIKVVIARSIEEISVMMADGRVDIFMDSSYPTVLVRRASGSRIVLESLVNGERSYHSMIIASRSSGVDELGDLRGRMVALQERYSTSGYLLPAAILLGAGFELAYAAGGNEMPPADRIGFFFSGDEENTLAMIRKGIIVAGALSSQDYEQLPQEVVHELTVLQKSPEVPRKLVSVRAGFDEELESRVIDVLLAIDNDDRQAMVNKHGWPWRFAELDDRSHAGIEAVEEMIRLTDSEEFH